MPGPLQAAEAVSEDILVRPEPPPPFLPSGPIAPESAPPVRDVVLPVPAASAASAVAPPAKSPVPVAPEAPKGPLPPTASVPPGARPLILPPVVRTDAWYAVEAPDDASADLVLTMAQKMREITVRFFTWPDHLPRPVEIQLVPAASANFTDPYEVNWDPSGRFVAQVRWGPESKFSDTCLALGAVTLKSIVVWKDGTTFVDKTPDWLALAMGKMLEVSLKPAVAESLAQQAAELGNLGVVLSLRQITTARGPFNEGEKSVLAVHAYWLARYLEQQCAGPAVAAALFTALAAGANPGLTISTAFPDQFHDVVEFELWWQVGYRDLMRTRIGPVETMAASRARLDRLAFVDLPSKDGAPKHTALSDAWTGREDKTVRDTLAAEVVAGPAMLLQINPVYHNAALSLLSALGKLHGDSEKEFRDAWAQYLADRADAEVYEATVEAALRGI